MTVDIFACGDIVNNTSSTGRICGSDLARIIGDSDYAVCNFEAPVAGFGRSQEKSGPLYAQRAETLTGLKAQGFDLVLLANNHMMDFGTAGLSATMQEASKAGLDAIGAGLDFEQAYAPLVKEIQGLRFGLVNAGEAQFGVLDYFERNGAAGYAWVNHRRIDETVRSLKESCDYVIVFSHAGLGRYPVPQKEWRHRYKQLCALGADVVIGSHPHVPQGYEQHNGSLIFYSLGNFYFDSRKFPGNADSTYSVLLNFPGAGNAVTFEPVFHYRSDGLIRLAPEQYRADLAALNDLLGDRYREEHDAMCEAAYRKIRGSVKLSVSPFPLERGLRAVPKRVTRRLFGRDKPVDKETLLLHLLRNESYHHAAKHALELQFQRKYGNGN